MFSQRLLNARAPYGWHGDAMRAGGGDTRSYVVEGQYNPSWTFFVWLPCDMHTHETLGKNSKEIEGHDAQRNLKLMHMLLMHTIA